MYAATEDDGVFRSTNNGVNWSAFNTGLEGIPGAKNVRTVFTSGTTVYAGTTAGLFKSIGGGGFQPVAQGPEEDPKNPKKLNAPVQAVFTGILPGSPMLAAVASGGVYRSTDGGATWQKPAPGNGMVAAETVWSLGSFKDNGALIYAATQSGIYISTNFGASLDAVQRRHHGHDDARLGRRQVPEHLLRGHHRRPVPLDHPRPHLEPDQRGHHRPRDHAVQRASTRSASTPRPTTASSRARPTWTRSRARRRGAS